MKFENIWCYVLIPFSLILSRQTFLLSIKVNHVFKEVFEVTVESCVGQTHRNSFPEISTLLHEITYKIIPTVVSFVSKIIPSKSSVFGQ